MHLRYYLSFINHFVLNFQEPDAQKDEESASFHNVERHPASFVDNVMEALTAEKEEDVKPDTPAGSGSETPYMFFFFQNARIKLL